MHGTNPPAWSGCGVWGWGGSTPTTELHDHGRSGRHNAATRRNMRREEREDCPGPRKETTTRRNVTQGGGGIWGGSSWRLLCMRLCARRTRRSHNIRTGPADLPEFSERFPTRASKRVSRGGISIETPPVPVIPRTTQHPTSLGGTLRPSLGPVG